MLLLSFLIIFFQGKVTNNIINTNDNLAATTEVSNDYVIPGGMPIGIYMETQGVMVLGTDKIEGLDGLNYEPSSNIVKSGDYIIGVNHNPVSTKTDLIDSIKNLNDEHVVLDIRRNSEQIEVKLNAIEAADHQYKLGIWVRDNVQGLGTITFIDSNSNFGALGHGIHDVDTNKLLEISQGTLYNTSISAIKKGENGSPGGMEGVIIYNSYNIVGEIYKNTEAGIYGHIDKLNQLISNQNTMQIAKKEEVKEGKATIRCCVDGEVKEYDIEIVKVNTQDKELSKGIVIEVTDPKLLEITGGIVQGMSGSPIIQDGKLVGAVTHVFVQNSKKGYGIFVDNMTENVK